MFLRPILKTDERVAIWGQNFIKTCRPRSGVLPNQIGLAVQLDHRYGSKWMLDKLHRLGYTESYSETQNYKYCFLNERNRFVISDTSKTLDSNLEEADKKIDNDIVIDDALNNLSVLPDAKNEISNKDYVVSREESKSSRTVTQFIGDNIDINITSIHGNTPFHSMGLIKVTSPTLTLSDPRGTEVVHRLQMKAHDKFKILKKAEVKILPFSNRKNSGLNTITFVPIDELSTSMMQDQPLLTSGDTLGSRVANQSSGLSVHTRQLEWLDEEHPCRPH